MASDQSRAPRPVFLRGEALISVPSGGKGTCQHSALTRSGGAGLCRLRAPCPLPRLQPALHAVCPLFLHPGVWPRAGGDGELGDATSPPHPRPASLPVPTEASPHTPVCGSPLCMEPIGIFGFKKAKLFLSPSPSVISFLLVVRILPLALQPGRGPNSV